jgi:hypothetical protein
MKYLLDANTYIQAMNTYYHVDFCPAYWDWLDRQFNQVNSPVLTWFMMSW